MFQNRVSYGYYFNDYGMGSANALTEEQFVIYEARARAFLRGICKGEIPTHCSDDAFACVCALAEELSLQKRCQNIKSESADGYSVTFENPKSSAKELYHIASLYLGHLGVLYAGVE